jgi:hypothetical protein
VADRTVYDTPSQSESAELLKGVTTETIGAHSSQRESISKKKTRRRNGPWLVTGPSS